MGEVAKAPGVGRLQPGAVVEQRCERYLENAFQLAWLVHELGNLAWQVGDEGNDREVGDRRIYGLSGAQGNQAATRYADLLGHLALGCLPRRLAFMDAPSRQRDLPGVIPEIGPASDERHLPAPIGFVQDEDHGRLPGAPAELAPAVDWAEQAFEASQEVDVADLRSPPNWSLAPRASKLRKVAEMIDRTSTRIEQQETALRRHNRRRYAFQRMLEASDRVLWRLEEMNRDGVKTVPAPVRAELREVVETMPNHVREPLRDRGIVQDTLDSLFEIQERLFRWRFPDWDDTEPDDFDYAS